MCELTTNMCELTTNTTLLQSRLLPRRLQKMSTSSHFACDEDDREKSREEEKDESEDAAIGHSVEQRLYHETRTTGDTHAPVARCHTATRAGTVRYFCE